MHDAAGAEGREWRPADAAKTATHSAAVDALKDAAHALDAVATLCSDAHRARASALVAGALRLLDEMEGIK